MSNEKQLPPFNRSLEEWTKLESVRKFILDSIALCKPDRVYICNGSLQEYDELCASLVEAGVFRPVTKRPRSFWARTTPDDVARVEKRTFICSRTKDDAGPTNNWVDPEEMKKTLNGKFSGCMVGRTMYVVPYCMGPVGSKHSHVGIEITDSAYVAVNLQIMTRMGDVAMSQLRQGDVFVPGLHSVGMPLSDGQKDTFWPCNPEKYICHFPEERSIMSFGSGYGGNALLNKKCYALRIASVMAHEGGWLAEHMLIMGLTSPQGEKKFFCAAFPSGCGKTNLAMIQPSLPGWKVECIGDDIAWLKFGEDGRLYAINPENGFFGIASGTSEKTNPNALRSLNEHTIFTNTGYTADGDVWWEGLTKEPPAGVTTWLNEPYTGEGVVAQPNSRFTAPIRNCPIASPEVENPNGVPISGIIFGGRRPTLVPLVMQTFSWAHGTLCGSMLNSQTTAAAEGAQGKLRYDPFAMLPFCGYNMGDYFEHWLRVGASAKDPKQLPQIFYVNWFRQDAEKHFMWPGFGDNVRVLKWMFERIDGKGAAVETPIGYVPVVDESGSKGGLDISGMDLKRSTVDELLHFDAAGWQRDLASSEEYLSQFGDRLSSGIRRELEALKTRVSTSLV